MRGVAHPDENKIIDYLNSASIFLGSPGIAFDVITPSSRPIGATSILSDGVWMWPQYLAYYVKNYRLALPEAFVEHIIIARTARQANSKSTPA